MTRLRQIRALTHGLCVSGALVGLTGDVLLNPHLYGEHVSWTAWSTVIATTVLAMWLAVISITSWAGRRRTPRELPGANDCG